LPRTKAATTDGRDAEFEGKLDFTSVQSPQAEHRPAQFKEAMAHIITSRLAGMPIHAPPSSA
jgi:hypothetical protein